MSIYSAAQEEHGGLLCFYIASRLQDENRTVKENMNHEKEPEKYYKRSFQVLSHKDKNKDNSWTNNTVKK